MCCCATLISCASIAHRDMQDKLVMNLSNKHYHEAIKIANNKDFLDDKHSVLLRALEQGTTYYFSGKYYQSLQKLDEAQKIANELFTISVSNKILSIATNTGLKDYSGDPFELSLIRFYKSLTNYQLYKIGKYETHVADNGKIIPEKQLTSEEKISHLRKARSNIMEWTSLTNSYNNNSKKIIYNTDLLEKIWGAFVFEENGSMNDMTRATAMYKTAKKILNGEYNILETYNSNSDKFKKNIAKIDAKNYIIKTDESKTVEQFIDKQINNLSIDKGNNLVILVNEKNVLPIKVEKINVPIEYGLLTDTSSDFFNFLVLVMGTNALTSKPPITPIISVEVPYMEKPQIANTLIAEIYDVNNTKIKELKLNVIVPISELMYRTYKEKEKFIRTQLITMTSLKYVTAITTTYAMYKNADSPLLEMAAVASFIAMKKGIDKTSYADLRSWRTLPDNIRFTADNLKNGQYTLKIKNIENKAIQEVYSKQFAVNGDDTTFIEVNL